MNNEPVAWMLADKEAEHIRSIMAVQHDFVPEGCVEIPLYTHQYERPHNTVLVPCDKLAEMQAEIEALKAHPVKELPNNHQYIAQLEMTVRNQQAEIEALKVKIQILLEAQDYSAKLQIDYISKIEALKKDLAKYDELAIDELNGKRTVWCACGDSIPPNSGALCGNCVSARPSQTLLTMTFEEMYPIAEKHLGHAIGLYNWKIFGDAILRKAQEK